MGVKQAVGSAAEFGEFGLQPSFYFFGRADRRGRFEDDEITCGDDGREGARRGFDEGEIREAGAISRDGERRRDGEDEDVCRGRLEGCLEIAGLHRRAHEDVEVRLLNVDPAAVDRIDHRRGDVDADNVTTLRREDGSSREADIAEAEDAEGGHLNRGMEGLKGGHEGRNRVELIS
jgi:hypothetical protein